MWVTWWGGQAQGKQSSDKLSDEDIGVWRQWGWCLWGHVWDWVWECIGTAYGTACCSWRQLPPPEWRTCWGGCWKQQEAKKTQVPSPFPSLSDAFKKLLPPYRQKRNVFCSCSAPSRICRRVDLKQRNNSLIISKNLKNKGAKYS